GTRWLAGNAFAEVVMDRERITSRAAGRECGVALGGEPLRQLGAQLDALGIPEYRAFGYVAFEAGHLAHEGLRPRREGPPLAHLIVPEVEVRWNVAGTTIRSRSADLLRRVIEVLSAERELPELVSTAVDLDAPAARERFEQSVAAVLRG